VTIIAIIDIGIIKNQLVNQDIPIPHFSISLSFPLPLSIFYFQLAEYYSELAKVGELEVLMFNLAQMYIRITNAQFSTSAPILVNPSCMKFFYFSFASIFYKTSNCSAWLSNRILICISKSKSTFW
jgi:hypothetical protein